MLKGTESRIPGRPVPLVAFLCLLLVLSSDTSVAQMSNEIRLTNDLVTGSKVNTEIDRSKVLAQVRDRLKPYRTSDPDVRAVSDILERQADWLSLGPVTAVDDLAKIMSVTGQAERARLLRQLRADLLDRMSHLIASNYSTKIGSREAQQIVDFARSFAQALDDLGDPSVLGGKTSALTRTLTRLNGIANLVNALEDPEAKRLLGGLRGTIGTWRAKLRHHDVGMANPISVFDVPSRGVGAILNTTRAGYYEASRFLDDTSRAIAGDPAALERLPQHAARVGKILSRENYGRVMFDALTESTIDKLPFVRTLMGWFQPTTNAAAISWLIGTWKFFSTRNNSDPDYMLLEFQMESSGVTGYIRKLNSAAAAAGYQLNEPVYRYYVDYKSPNPGPYDYPKAKGDCLYTERDTGRQRWISSELRFENKWQGLTDRNACAINWLPQVWYRSEKVN